MLLLLTLQQLAYSQKGKNSTKNCPPCRTQQEIIWDFQTGKITEPCCLQKGINLPIKVVGINRTLYGIVINEKFRTFDVQIPSILNFAKEQQQVQQNIATATAQNQGNRSIGDSSDSLPKITNTPPQQAADSLAQLLLNSKKIIDCGACLEAILQKDIGYATAQDQLALCTEGKTEAQVRAALTNIQQSIQQEQNFILIESSNPIVLQQLSTALKSTDISKAIEDIMTLYTKITNPKTFEFYTILPIQEAYELNLELKVTSKTETTVAPPPVNLTYAIRGIKISISPGLFVNYFPGARTYYKEDFQLNNLPTDSVTLQSSFDDNSLLPSIGALIHVSFLGCKNHDIAISTGASTHLSSGDMRWHIGTSLLLGKQRRFVLSAGLSLGQNIQELNQSYQLNTPYPTAALEDKTITQEVAHIGAYLGVFYNIPAPPKS